MKIALLLGKSSYSTEPSFVKMCADIAEAGHLLVNIDKRSSLTGFDMLLSIGGDGTYLTAASIASPCSVPVLGVNLGRLGFLSENLPQAVSEALRDGKYYIKDRTMLQATLGSRKLVALNEVVVSRKGTPMLGIRIKLNGILMPVCWADGLLVSTASGSTAYSLSVGGPIVHPSCRVLIIAPIAPHNLNVRPLVIPPDSSLSLEFVSRETELQFSWDNNSTVISRDEHIDIKVAGFSLRRVVLNRSHFVKALSEKLFWGEDKRNEYDGK